MVINSVFNIAASPCLLTTRERQRRLFSSSQGTRSTSTLSASAPLRRPVCARPHCSGHIAETEIAPTDRGGQQTRGASPPRAGRDVVRYPAPDPGLCWPVRGFDTAPMWVNRRRRHVHSTYRPLPWPRPEYARTVGGLPQPPELRDGGGAQAIRPVNPVRQGVAHRRTGRPGGDAAT